MPCHQDGAERSSCQHLNVNRGRVGLVSAITVEQTESIHRSQLRAFNASLVATSDDLTPGDDWQNVL
jgi:hypothetical protein